MHGNSQDTAEGSEEDCALVTAAREGRRGSTLPLVVALHARGGDAATGLASARARFGEGPDLVALQAARPCNPFQSNLRTNDAYSGFSWYLGDDPGRPEAASFGDALAQVEAFVRRLDRPFVLAGEGQGAALALALAAHEPAGLAGVFAPGAELPRIDGWTAPRAVEEIAAPVVTQPGPAGDAWLASLAIPGRSVPRA